MSKNIFINNLDTYVSQAIFKELRNDQPDEDGNPNPDANNIFGTYISMDSTTLPESGGVKKMLKRSKPNLAMTYISKCDLIVYDLHSGSPEDVQLALDAMNKPRKEDDDGSQEKTIILISSLLAWDATPRNLEEIRSPEDVAEEERILQIEADRAATKVAKEKRRAEYLASLENQEPKSPVPEGTSEAPLSPALNADDKSASAIGDVEKSALAEGEGAAAEGGDVEAPAEFESEETDHEPIHRKRKRYLHHPFTESDYLKRKASSEYARIKEVEDRVLQFKKENVKTFVISAGVLYGAGEAIFNHHFERAWKQDPEKLPVIGEGKNHLPTIHVKDLARMVKKIFEAPPETKYIFGIDNTKKPTQQKLIQSISDGIGTGLVVSEDIPMEYDAVHPKRTPLNLHSSSLDWKKFVMLNIKAKPSPIFVQESQDAQGSDNEGEGEGDEGGFQWHCKSGLAVNIQLVKDEFCKERGLKPFKIAITGKPCSGKSFYAAQLAKHYGVPHIHKEQVLHDIQNWNKEKEAEYHHRVNEKKRLAGLAEERAVEQARLDEEARVAAEEKKAADDALKADAGSDAASSPPLSPSSDKKPDTSAAFKGELDEEANEGGEEPEGGEEVKEEIDIATNYARQMKQHAEDEADSDDEFKPLDLKLRINKNFEENPSEKRIMSEVMSEAFRWRLSQNDCQNRGYVLDGYPVSYETSLEVFFVTPEKPAPKAPVLDDDGNPIEEDPVDPEEAEELAKKYAPKFQEHIYPDSVVMLRGSDDLLRRRASELKAEDNKKWDQENLERRLAIHNEQNSISLFNIANNDPMLGHPKAQKHMLPLSRFFQENKTEVFGIDCDGNTFEMFESMRVYVERNGRSYNYLPSVRVLNVKREEELVKEEKNFKSEKATNEEAEKNKSDANKTGLEKLQDGRLESIQKHMEELESTSNLNMRQFLMKQIIPVLTEGMIDVYRVGPTDPVDYLAGYIFEKSNNLRKQVKTKKSADQ